MTLKNAAPAMVKKDVQERNNGEKTLVDNISKENIRRDFQNYRAYVNKVRHKKDQLEAVKTKLTGLQSVRITDIPKTASPKNDKNLYLLQEKIDIEDSLKKLIKKKETERKKLNKILKDLESNDTANQLARTPEVLTAEASVLKLRYMCGFSWEEINKAFYSEDENFEINTDVYLKRIFKYHGQAFIDLQKMMKEKT